MISIPFCCTPRYVCTVKCALGSLHRNNINQQRICPSPVPLNLRTATIVFCIKATYAALHPRGGTMSFGFGIGDIIEQDLCLGLILLEVMR